MSRREAISVARVNNLNSKFWIEEANELLVMTVASIKTLRARRQ